MFKFLFKRPAPQDISHYPLGADCMPGITIPVRIWTISNPYTATHLQIKFKYRQLKKKRNLRHAYHL
ncbi:hypothetical protein [Chitinophaga nivalis]|uniref:Uncharacterized protein n=1 Tax=Chitinophaga nivalis TaxID=2991709 RepID=A0ABT3IQK7_9BACT|nr:hypothetical protein [Chitinophaga nivalis]MCW3464154.1 hypothetical protein [Chitinophaga nivalis]MCW3486156.1 hypothetical protein [Chitinophaga nivalis]